MKRIKINKISKRHYKGDVYNLELNSMAPQDDLFWIEQQTGIVTHNCFPKDLRAIVYASKEAGYQARLLEEVLKSNDRIGEYRKKRRQE